MTSPDQYRFKAAQLLIRAAREPDPRVQADYESMAQSYLRLADLAEQSAKPTLLTRRRRPAALSKR